MTTTSLTAPTPLATLSTRPRLMPTALAFVGRDFRTARSYKVAFFTNIASLAMSLLTFRFISTLVGDSPALAGIGNYFGFVVVGMAMAQVLDGTLNAPGGAARAEQMQGTLEALATTPLSPASLAAGWLAYPILNSLITSILMLSIAGPLGLQLGPNPNFGAAILVFAASALAFAGLGIIGAAVVLVLQQAAGVTKWIAAGLSLISGVFFPLSLFPRWVAVLSEASPLTHSLRAVRGALLKGTSTADLLPDLAALLAFAIILLPTSVGLLSLALRRARRTGAIATY